MCNDYCFTGPYLWARTVKCPNPTCAGTVPLVQQLWLLKSSGESTAIRMTPDGRSQPPVTEFEVVHGQDIDFDPDQGTMSRTSASCPYCHTTIAKRYLESIGVTVGFGSQLMAVVPQSSKSGKTYLDPSEALCPSPQRALHEHSIPDEAIPYLRSIFNCHVYGLRKWSALFSLRQLSAVAAFAEAVRAATDRIATFHDGEYAAAVNAYLAVLVARLADFNTMLCAWKESAGHTFSRQALGMIWDYCEINPFSTYTGSWQSQLRQVVPVINFCAGMDSHEKIRVGRGSASRSLLPPNSLEVVLTDPPYYDAVPYADLSDFFYVWLKRTLSPHFANLVSTPLTPKGPEIVQLTGRNTRATASK